MLESDNLTTVPDAGAVEERMGEIELSALRSGVSGRKGKQSVKVEFDKKNINVKLKANGKLEHLKGKGFHVSINIPFKVTIGSGNNKVEIDITATFQEEIVLKQKISTKRHKIGFLKYDYSLNASFEVGNYTGIGFTAEIKTAGEEDKSMIEKLDEIMERMEDYHEAGGVTITDGTMEGLSEIYQSVMENANDTWIDIVEVKLFENNGNAFLHIFCWQVKGTFVVSANLAVSMGMSFEYITQKQYNFSVRVKAQTSTNQTIDIITPQYNFDFYVVGTIGIRAGIRLEMYVGLFSLKLDKIGIAAEAGAYARLWGYFFYHLQWKQGAGKTQSSAGAMLIEIGMYLDIKFVAQLFNSSKLSWCPTIYAKEWPLWSAGERQNVYDFAITNDTAYSFQKTKTLTLPGTTYAMKSMDLKNGNISQISKDDNTESHFQISFSNDKFRYSSQKNTVTVDENADPMGEETDMIVIWKKAPLSFSSKPIQKVIHITWSDPDNVFAMSFDTMGGTAVDQIVAGKGAEIIQPENPEKVGYVFAGWYEDEAYSTPFRFSNDTLTAMPDHNLTLYAKWDPATDTKYTVEHYYENLNGTYELQITDSDTYRGTTDGQTNATASSQDSDKYTAKSVDQQTIAADGSTVVKIYYDLNSYTVTFKDGVSGDNTIARTYKHGETLAVPTFARKGYTFRDWNTEFDTDEDQNPIAIQDVTFTARWSPNDNTISFVSNGGSEVESKTVKTGVTFDAPVAPAKTGYDFKGWFTDPSCLKEWNFATGTVSSSMTLYAKWEGEKYTVNFNQNQGETLSASSKQVTFGAVYGNLPTSTRTGYTFVGWFTAAIGGEKVEATTPVLSSAKDQTLYAHWTEADVSYTVEHYQQNTTDDGYTLMSGHTESKKGKTNSETNATARSYEGFAAKEIQQETIQANGSTVVKVYYDRKKYTISWNVNGGDALTGTYTQGESRYGVDITSPDTPTRTGYDFNGWDPQPGTVPAHNQEFTAQWELKNYAITYDLNGGTNHSDNPATYTYSKGLTLKDPSRTGYTFQGWYTSSEFGDEAITEISATQTGNIILYAKWDGIGYTVTFDVNGGNELDQTLVSKSVTYGETYGDLPTPTHSEDFEFDGWYTDQKFETKVTESDQIKIAGDHTLYAKWNPIYTTYTHIQIRDQPIQVAKSGRVKDEEGVTFDAATNTLTLNNATIIGGTTTSNVIKLGKMGNIYPKIHVLGTNTVKSTTNWNADNIQAIEITSSPKDATFTGNGTLNISMEDVKARGALGLHGGVDGAHMIIDGPTIHIYGGEYLGVSMFDTPEFYTLYLLSGTLTVQGSADCVYGEGIKTSLDSENFATVQASTNYDGTGASEVIANKENLTKQGYKYISITK